MYVFVLGVLLSGMLMAEQFGIAWSPTLLVLVAIAAAIWTTYYRITVEPRIETMGRNVEQRHDSGELDSSVSKLERDDHD